MPLGAMPAVARPSGEQVGPYLMMRGESSTIDITPQKSKMTLEHHYFFNRRYMFNWLFFIDHLSFQGRCYYLKFTTYVSFRAIQCSLLASPIWGWKLNPYHPWDWYIYLHFFAGFYGSCR